MLKTQYPHLAAAVAEMPLKKREIVALALSTSKQPVLQSLAFELRHANLVEAVEFMQRDIELSDTRLTEAERQFAEAGIPPVPPASGPPVFLTEDELPKRA